MALPFRALSFPLLLSLPLLLLLAWTAQARGPATLFNQQEQQQRQEQEQGARRSAITITPKVFGGTAMFDTKNCMTEFTIYNLTANSGYAQAKGWPWQGILKDCGKITVNDSEDLSVWMKGSSNSNPVIRSIQLVTGISESGDYVPTLEVVGHGDAPMSLPKLTYYHSADTQTETLHIDTKRSQDVTLNFQVSEYMLPIGMFYWKFN